MIAPRIARSAPTLIVWFCCSLMARSRTRGDDTTRSRYDRALVTGFFQCASTPEATMRQIDSKELLGILGVQEPPLPTYNEAGIDISVIRWMLSKSPAERLAVMQDYVAAAARLDGECSSFPRWSN